MVNERMNPVEFARLRRQMADEFERQMWQLLRNRQRCNQTFRREHPLGIYTADFYCVAAKLVIEVDGDSHLTEEARQYDRVRDQWMKKQGIRILRFTCTEVIPVCCTSRGFCKSRVKTKWHPTLARSALVLKPLLVESVERVGGLRVRLSVK